jgi:hypothetical protein
VCIYCGKPADSVEHIFATWIIHELSRYTGRTFWQGTFTQGDKTTTFLRRRNKRGNPTFEFTTDRVCRECNNGWMNRIDDRVRRYLPNLMRGRPYVTSNKMCKAIAAWAVKTAVTARFAHINPNPVEGEWAAQLRRDEIPSRDWAVWIARYTGDRGLWYQQHEINIEGLVRIHPAPQEVEGDRPVYTDGVLMTLVIGQFCVQVLRINGPATPLVGPGMQAIPIWPPSRNLNWPPSEDLDDESLEEFASRFIGAGMHFVARRPVLHDGTDTPRGTAIFSTPATEATLADDENYVLTINVDCGQCGTTTPVPHDTGGPFRELKLPYTAAGPFNCPVCGNKDRIEFTIRTVPPPQKTVDP